MKGLENESYLTVYLLSNIVALLLLLCAWKWPRTGRLFFFFLFAWASWINWITALNAPADYLNYGSFAIAPYASFIYGWFSHHIVLSVGIIATCQALIAVSMLMKGLILRIGTIGAIFFLLAITPLGVGSGFPCTLIMAIAMHRLLRHSHYYLWLVHGEDESSMAV